MFYGHSSPTLDWSACALKVTKVPFFPSTTTVCLVTFHPCPPSLLYFYYSSVVRAMKHMDFHCSSDFILYILVIWRMLSLVVEGGGNEIMGFLKLNAFVCLQNEELKGKAVVGGFFIHSQFDLK